MEIDGDAKFELKIKMGASAVMRPEDVAHLLRKVAKRLEEEYIVPGGWRVRPVMDINGNKVGEYMIHCPLRPED